MKSRSLPRAFLCQCTHFIPATNQHVAFGKENFSLPSTALNVLRPLCFSLLSSLPHSFLIYRVTKHLAECSNFYRSTCRMWEITRWSASCTETASSGVMPSGKGRPVTSFCSLTQLPAKRGGRSHCPSRLPTASSSPFVSGSAS